MVSNWKSSIAVARCRWSLRPDADDGPRRRHGLGCRVRMGTCRRLIDCVPDDRYHGSDSGDDLNAVARRASTPVRACLLSIAARDRQTRRSCNQCGVIETVPCAHGKIQLQQHTDNAQVVEYNVPVDRTLENDSMKRVSEPVARQEISSPEKIRPSRLVQPPDWPLRQFITCGDVGPTLKLKLFERRFHAIFRMSITAHALQTWSTAK